MISLVELGHTHSHPTGDNDKDGESQANCRTVLHGYLPPDKNNASKKVKIDNRHKVRSPLVTSDSEISDIREFRFLYMPRAIAS
jgi:hypothetical protein